MVIFLDGADAILENAHNPLVAGFTTNPSLLKKAGVKNYMLFAKNILFSIKDKPVALEVMTDNLLEMYSQGVKLQELGDNVNVKIPVTNSYGVSTIPAIAELVRDGIRVNVTAITEIKQVVKLLPVLHGSRGYVSVFAGRIADTGVDPVPIMSKVKYLIGEIPDIELIWASCREVFNIYQAERCSDIITVSSDLLKKYEKFKGMDLKELSLQTVKQFTEDAQGYDIA